MVSWIKWKTVFIPISDEQSDNDKIKFVPKTNESNNSYNVVSASESDDEEERAEDSLLNKSKMTLK